jgi:hypothetical protein
MGLKCRLFGHRFVEFGDGFKRACKRCNREQWVMGRPYPLIGQAKYYWMDMGADEEGRRARQRDS